MTNEGPVGRWSEEQEAQRLEAALAALDAGRDPSVDPREDPELAGLVQTAAVLQHLFSDATDEPAFRSFRERSRLAVLHRSESLSVPRALASRSATSGRAVRVGGLSRDSHPGIRLMGLTPHARRWLRGRVLPALAPIAAAAAAAAVTFIALGGPAGAPPHVPQVASVVSLSQVGEPAREAPAENLTPRSVDEQLARLQVTLQQIASTAQRGEPVRTDLLRRVTEDAASVKQQIDRAPERVSPQVVASLQQAASQGREILSGAKPEPGGEGALSAAQLSAEQAEVSAARYLAERAEPASTPAATPPPATATPTPAPAPTRTPAATPGAGAN